MLQSLTMQRKQENHSVKLFMSTSKEKNQVKESVTPKE